ncbi:MAG TPA: deaminase [Verrucomicrobiae bacterium]|nr:deaminase [Verrucomicrobiae bacterium]
MSDEIFLKRAVHVATHSREPVKCGVVLVNEAGEMIAQAYNSQRDDEQVVNHAEIKALQEANHILNSRKLKGVTAYCSCEPCVMCLVALSLADVERVVFTETMRDVDPESSLSQVDAREFVNRYLRGIPKLERLVVS